MEKTIQEIHNCRFELLTEADRFIGLGRVWIEDIQVRSGRLPLQVYTQSFLGHELDLLRLIDVRSTADSCSIELEALFKPMAVKLMRDHSFDPIHDTGDWGEDSPSGKARIVLVLATSAETFNGTTFTGFSYHYEYQSNDMPIFYLLDKATWELDGNIEGATVYNQSACSDPVVSFDTDTFWTTEALIFFAPDMLNQCMTHNLPRWTDHQCFDFQFRNDHTLIGVFDHVDLIRSLHRRDSGRPELKVFDKHIFDESLTYRITPKQILVNSERKTLTDQQNLWTWIYDELHQRARDEFGIKEQPPIPCMGHHHWTNYTIDTYYKDILPACANVGIKAIFAENFKKSDASESNRLPRGNMCCSHEYEVADTLGGTTKFKDYIERCHEYGVKNFLWTNTYVSLAAELNADQRDERGWFMAMEDTRIKYGGAYTMVSSNLDLKNPDARKYWVDAHKRIVEETGLDGYFIDSHYNLFFMPVNYKTGHPRTSWRESLQVMKELQDCGVEWQIESFGPFGQNIHGHPASYNPSCTFICYHVGYGDNYVTVPIPGITTEENFNHEPAYIYYQLAHKSPCKVPLFIDGDRIDKVYGDEHRQILKQYHDCLPTMFRRYLQEDGNAVLWHDREMSQVLIWNFKQQSVDLDGIVRDLTTNQGAERDASGKVLLEPTHTYQITGGEMITKLTNTE